MDPQQHIQIIENRLIPVELLLVDPATRELGGMVPGFGRHKFGIGRFFDKGVIPVVHPDIGVGHVVVCVLIQCCHGLQGDGLIPVVGIDDTDEIPLALADALVHAIVNSAVGLRGYYIPNPPLCK